MIMPFLYVVIKFLKKQLNVLKKSLITIVQQYHYIEDLILRYGQYFFNEKYTGYTYHYVNSKIDSEK